MAIRARYVPGASSVTFVDRQEIFAAFDEEMAVLGERPRLLSLYGVGGIGKSRLLHELRRRPRDRKSATAALNLQEPDLRSAIGGLADLRSQLGETGVSFERFDIAYARWWQRLHPMQPLSAAPHPWVQGAEIVGEVVGEAFGAGLVGSAVRAVDATARKMRERRLMQDDRVLREFPELSLEGQRDAVVHLFAEALNEHLHVLLLDAYEALGADGVWVRDLCGQLDGLVVVASREPLDWERHHPEWPGRIRSVQVPPLPVEARVELLDELGVHETDHWVEASHGVPYFLHLASEASDSRRASTSLEERFLRHVDPGLARYLRLLSVARVFDRGVFEAVAQRYHLPHDPATWQALSRYSFIARLGPDALQMHQLMARAVRRGLGRETESEMHALLQRVWTARAERSPEPTAWREAAYHATAQAGGARGDAYELLFESGVDRAPDVALVSWTGSDAELLAFVDRLALFGKVALDAFRDDLESNGGHVRLARLVAAEAALVVGDATTVLDLLGATPHQLPRDVCEPAAREALAAANAYRIAGDTREAIDRFGEIWPAHRGPCRYDAGGWLADLAMAEGRFAEAITIADDVEHAAPAERVVLRADLARLRSLAHRFAFDASGAGEHLERARRLYDEAGHHVGLANILTNEAEILAQIDPEAAVDVAWRAVRTHEAMGSDLETGKALTALALALIASGDTGGAGEAIERARVLLDRCGYRSGRARAELVAAFGLARSGADDDAFAAVTWAVGELEAVGVYPVLIVLADLLLDRIGRPDHAVRDAAVRARARVQPLSGREGTMWRDARDHVARLLGDSWDVEYGSALATGSRLSGYYNINVRSGDTLLRVPIAGADSMDLRIWNEADILAALRGRFEAAPRLVSVSREPAYQVHEWVDGDVLNDISPKGTSVPEGVAAETGRLLAGIGDVSLDRLPPTPGDWPATGDSAAFARQLCSITRSVCDTFHDHYEGLWISLGIPADPFAPLDLDELTPRASVLVHSDVHRKNLIVQGDGRLVILDWELALAGDPVYELAVHLHKADYTSEDEERVRRAWVQAWEERGGAPLNWEPDVSRYLAHERIKSAVVDSVRYSKDLEAGRRAAGSQDPPSSATSDSLGDRALEAARNYAPKLARARSVWGDERPVDLDAVAAALMAASSG